MGSYPSERVSGPGKRTQEGVAGEVVECILRRKYNIKLDNDNISK